MTRWDGVGTWILGIETPTTVRLGASGVESAIRVVDADMLEIVSVTAADGCVAGDAGTYEWSLSPSARNLHLEPRTDSCEQRLADIPGDWIVSDCPAYPDDFCLGPLDPGVHVANYFTPLVPSSAWELDPAAMRYRVPSGWSNTYDAANEYTLEPLVKHGDTGLYMWTDATIVSAASPCTPQPRVEGRASPGELASWLSAQDTLTASGPVDVTVGGLDGLLVDVQVRPGASLPCVGDGIRYAPFLVHVEGNGMQWGFKADTRNRLYLLDLDDGRTLVVHVAADGESATEIFAEGVGIVESVELRTP